MQAERDENLLRRFTEASVATTKEMLATMSQTSDDRSGTTTNTLETQKVTKHTMVIPQRTKQTGPPLGGQL